VYVGEMFERVDYRVDLNLTIWDVAHDYVLTKTNVITNWVGVKKASYGRHYRHCF